MIDSSSFAVGFVSSPHPHAPMHIKTLDVLTEVEEVHLCGLEGEDLEAMAMKSSKVRSKTNSLEKLLRLSHLDALVVSVRNDLCCAVLCSMPHWKVGCQCCLRNLERSMHQTCAELLKKPNSTRCPWELCTQIDGLQR